MPKVSIIIPVYNVKDYLKKCVNSVISQTYKDFEIILVDDGSTDDSPAICDDYAKQDNRVKVIHKQNGGQGDARNVGIDIAEGEYIIFVDSDDYISEKMLEETVTRAEKYDADMVLHDYYTVNENGEILFRYSSVLPREKLICPSEDKYILNFSLTAASTKLYKKSIFKDSELRFAPRVWYEDLRLLPKLFTACERVVYADCEPLYYYLLRNNSTMHNGDIQKTKLQRIEAIKDIVDFYKQKGLYEQYIDEMEWIYIYHGFFLPVCEILRFNGRYKSAIKELKVFAKANVKSIYKNKYFYTLRRNEKILFIAICLKMYPLIRLLYKLKDKARG